MNLELASIKVWNLFRFPKEPQYIEFSKGETLIVGSNGDSIGSDSNGSGKSSILDAICWAITGKVLRDISVDGVVRRGQTEGGVHLCLRDTDNKDCELIYSIYRTRGIKEVLQFITVVDGEPVNDLGRRTTSQTQEEILRHLNLDLKKSLSDYINTVYFSSSTVRGFASKETSNVERMQLLTRFLNVEAFDFATERAKELHKMEVQSLSLAQNSIQEARSILPSDFNSFDAYEATVDENLADSNKNKADWMTYKTSLMEKLTEANKNQTTLAKIETLRLKTKQAEQVSKQYFDLTEKISEITEQIGELKKKEINTTELETKLAELRADEKEIREKHSLLRKEALDISNQLKKPLKCPQCSTMLHLQEGHLHILDVNTLKVNEEVIAEKTLAASAELGTVESIIKNTEEIKKKDATLKQTIALAEGKVRASAEQLARLPEVDTTDYGEEIKQLEASLSDVDIDSLKKEMKEAEEQIELLATELGQLKEIKRQIMTAKEKIIKVEADIKDIEQKVRNFEFWKQNFPMIKQLLIETYLPFFENSINYYLKFLNTGLSVALDLEKELKSGKTKQEFRIIVKDEHGSEAEYEAFSEGERKRIATCVGFAIRRIALSRNSLPLGFMKFDEIIDGLDDTGIGEFFNLLRSLPGQKLIVSHDDGLKQMFSNIIEAVRKDGITKLRTNYANVA